MDLRAEFGEDLRVALDVRVLQQALRNSPNGGLGGVGRYAFDLVRALTRRDDQVEYVLLVDSGAITKSLLEFASTLERTSITRVGIGRSLLRVKRGRIFSPIESFESPLLNRQIRLLQPDVVHVLNQPGPRLTLRPRVATFYDLWPLLTASNGGARPDRITARQLAWTATADIVICISHSTAHDVMRLLRVPQSRLRVIYPGVDTQLFCPGIVDPDRSGIGPDRPYFLHVGVLRERKNPHRLLQAFAKVAATHDDVDLVCVGPYQTSEAARAQVIRLAATHHISEKVHLAGDCDAARLVALYRGSAGLVFPSLHEGFGFPIVEALACGTPCVTSNVASMPEAGGDLAVYVDPLDEDSIAEAMRRLLDDDDLRHRVRTTGPDFASRFSWAATADAVARLHCELRHASSLEGSEEQQRRSRR